MLTRASKVPVRSLQGAGRSLDNTEITPSYSPDSSRIEKGGHPKTPSFCLSRSGEMYYNLWITNPERSFGSNQVVLGGMMLPVSAMVSNCSMDTG